MTHLTRSTSATRRRLLLRAALAWVLCLALTLVLFQACPAEAEANPSSQTVVVTNDVKSPAPDHLPGQAVHCHCLLHIAAPDATAAIAVPAIFHRSYFLGADDIRASAAGGLPYKPPRG